MEPFDILRADCWNVWNSLRFWSEAYGCEFAQEMKRKDRKTRFCGRNLLKPLRLSVVRPVNSDFKDRTGRILNAHYCCW